MQRLYVGEEKDAAQCSVRPSVPALFFVGAGLWGGIGCSYACLERAESLSILLCALFSLVGLVIACVALWRRRQKALFCLLVGICLGGICGSVAAFDFSQDCAASDVSSGGVYEFIVVEDATMGDFGSSCCATTTLSTGQSIKVRISFGQEEQLFRFGERFSAFTTFHQPGDVAASYYYRQGISCRATVFHAIRIAPSGVFGALLAFREYALACFQGYSGEGAAFLRAVLFGERSDLDEGGFYGAVKACGLAHLIAVSGAHLVVVSTFIGLFLRLLRINRYAAVVLQVLFIGCYLIFTGLPISAIRAAVMSVVTMTAVFAHRRSSGINALSLCVCAMLALNPQTSFSLSFALSVAATLGIIIFGTLMGDWCAHCFHLRQGFVRDALAMTLASNLLTLPLSAAAFSQISLIAPLANVIASPLFSLFCGGGLLAVIVCLLIPVVGSFFVGCFVVAAQAFCEGVILLARIPFAAIPFAGDMALLVAAAVLGVSILWIVWPRPSRRAGALLCLILLMVSGCVVVVVPRFAPDEIIMLDVGQGDAFLVRSQNATLLIDTGNHDTALLKGLARCGVYHLDGVIISHPDDDHCASLVALQHVVGVDRVLVAEDLLTCPCKACASLRENATRVVEGGCIEGMRVGDALTCGSFTARVLAPKTFVDEGGNADSLCVLLEHDKNADGNSEWKALMCGDAESEQIGALLESKVLGDIDIYKIGHHGSKRAITADQAAVLRPEIALCSVGQANRYGHPAAETLDALRASGARVFRTDEQGEVVCRLFFDRIEVEALR
ncbi:MAG: DNA internalization-related competence protein ComEC/Rec2 [Raoultibacter sp.]